MKGFLMTKYIWIEDTFGAEHYVNLDHIIKVTVDDKLNQYTVCLTNSNHIKLATDSGSSHELVVHKINEALYSR
jgi:hypothetical protein